jgi:hypothetical protein
MNDREFVCCDELSPIELIAARSSGQLVKWRKDATGRQWYRSTMKPIFGVPRGETIYAYEGDVDFEDEADNTEIVWLGDDDAE